FRALRPGELAELVVERGGLGVARAATARRPEVEAFAYYHWQFAAAGAFLALARLLFVTQPLRPPLWRGRLGGVGGRGGAGAGGRRCGGGRGGAGGRVDLHVHAGAALLAGGTRAGVAGRPEVVVRVGGVWAGPAGGAGGPRPRAPPDAVRAPSLAARRMGRWV